MNENPFVDVASVGPKVSDDTHATPLPVRPTPPVRLMTGQQRAETAAKLSGQPLPTQPAQPGKSGVRVTAPETQSTSSARPTAQATRTARANVPLAGPKEAGANPVRTAPLPVTQRQPDRPPPLKPADAADNRPTQPSKMVVTGTLTLVGDGTATIQGVGSVPG